jgi:hypothetical protein
MSAAQRRFRNLAAMLFFVWCLPLQATTGWFASTDSRNEWPHDLSQS